MESAVVEVADEVGHNGCTLLAWANMNWMWKMMGENKVQNLNLTQNPYGQNEIP